jgi:GTPase SAR1 family protein
MVGKPKAKRVATRRPARAPATPKPSPEAKRGEPSQQAEKIAVVGIPASGKTTYFRYLSGHFGLNLPIVYLPQRSTRSIPICGDISRDVVMEETTFEAVDPSRPTSEMETTTRMYVSRPMEDPTKLFVELSAGKEEQGVLTKYPLPTKYNQFVDMKIYFRYGMEGKLTQSTPMVLHTVDEAGGIISDYFTYDRLWIREQNAEVSAEQCRVIPQFETWPIDRQELWRHGLTLMGRFVVEADGLILLLSPQLSSLRESSQQVNLARGVLRYVRERNIPLVIAISKADLLKDFYAEIEQALTNRDFVSTFDTNSFLTDHDGSGLGSILVAAQSSGLFRTEEDAFLVASAISTGEGRPLLYGDTPTGSQSEESHMGVPVMVNTTLPVARICERVLAKRSGK